MKIWVKVIPVTPNKYGGVVFSDEFAPYKIIEAKYDFNTQKKAIRWVNVKFKEYKNAKPNLEK